MDSLYNPIVFCIIKIRSYINEASQSSRIIDGIIEKYIIQIKNVLK